MQIQVLTEGTVISLFQEADQALEDQREILKNGGDIRSMDANSSSNTLDCTST